MNRQLSKCGMDATRKLRIASLEVAILLLQREEERLQSLLSSELTSPEYRQQTKIDLKAVLESMKTTADEIVQLRTAL